MGARAETLATRIEQGAEALAATAEGFSAAEWAAESVAEGRNVGVLVHHVAAAYEAEAGLIGALTSGQDVAGVTWAVVDQMNAEHARASGAPRWRRWTSCGAIAPWPPRWCAGSTTRSSTGWPRRRCTGGRR